MSRLGVFGMLAFVAATATAFSTPSNGLRPAARLPLASSRNNPSITSLKALDLTILEYYDIPSGSEYVDERTQHTHYTPICNPSICGFLSFRMRAHTHITPKTYTIVAQYSTVKASFRALPYEGIQTYICLKYCSSTCIVQHIAQINIRS